MQASVVLSTMDWWDRLKAERIPLNLRLLLMCAAGMVSIAAVTCPDLSRPRRS